MDDTRAVRWLDDDEQVSWRRYVSGTTLLLRQLEQRLQAAHELSMDDYAILVLLSESPGRSLRMSRIAEAGIIARPQVTYRITRLEKAGVVERRPCDGDARGVEAHLTAHGLAVLEAAARDHVTSVRELLLDPLTPEQFHQLGEVMGVVFTALRGEDRDEARRA